MNGYDRTYAVVDLKAVRFNLEQARSRAEDCAGCYDAQGNKKKELALLAVIKANGYGHGAVPIAQYVQDSVEFFGVATLEEAVVLRTSGIQRPILILGYVSPKEYEVAVAYDLRLCISTEAEGDQLAQTAAKLGKKAYAHIKLDTGMTRLGFDACKESAEAVSRLAKKESLLLEGLFTHFSCADMVDAAYTQKQLAAYHAFEMQLKELGVTVPLRHTCNSAGIMRYVSPEDTMVRCGILTYGLYPSDEVNKRCLAVRPALSWYAHVICVREIPAGVCVSYGATFVSEHPMRLATVSVGYADGYPRALSNRGYVLIHGKRAKIVGRVCMDQMIVDITDIEEAVQVEDLVTLIGSDPHVPNGETITVEEIAELAGTFNYEFVCGISERVPRRYS